MVSGDWCVISEISGQSLITGNPKHKLRIPKKAPIPKPEIRRSSFGFLSWSAGSAEFCILSSEVHGEAALKDMCCAVGRSAINHRIDIVDLDL